jgi:hypothetical protein
LLSDERNWCELDASSSSFEVLSSITDRSSVRRTQLSASSAEYFSFQPRNRISSTLNRYLPRILNQKLSAPSHPNLFFFLLLAWTG